jgi:hypothetical protein
VGRLIDDAHHAQVPLGELRQVPLQGVPQLVPVWEPDPAAPASESPEGEG